MLACLTAKVIGSGINISMVQNFDSNAHGGEIGGTGAGHQHAHLGHRLARVERERNILRRDLSLVRDQLAEIGALSPNSIPPVGVFSLCSPACAWWQR
jgi:hypothetical protein